jgi:fermentation-respiration switch protein FrsA (DUF1100 family)
VIWLLWLGLGIVAGAFLALVLFGVLLYWHLRVKYLHHVHRIFQVKPLFVVPRGQPVPEAEDVALVTPDGLRLAGCYLKARGPRRGVLLFGVEFGSNRWSCVPYCERLLASGFDVFSFEFRSQGDSAPQPGYEPLQWVTHYEVLDMQAALAYLKGRSDADPRGVGFFGISKGGSAGLLAAVGDPLVRCFVTDGIFATYSTMVPYMRQWIAIYNRRLRLQALLPVWVYGVFGIATLRKITREKGCRFPHLEKAIRRLAPRPLLMIHGGADTYIKPEMAQALFAMAGDPKELWMVEGARHNQALKVAGQEYQQRVLDFFMTHLANGEVRHQPAKPEPDSEVTTAHGCRAALDSAASAPNPSVFDAR